MIQLIGLGGLARSGKDTAANLLTSLHGFTRVALADGVRGAYRDMDGMTGELTKELEDAGRGKRWADQTLGTECRSALISDGFYQHYVDHVLIKVRYLAIHHPRSRSRFVVPDIRFPAEVAGLDRAVRAWGGSCYWWSLEREGSGIPGPLGRHKSEHSMSDFEWSRHLDNNGSIGQLAYSIANALEEDGIGV